MTEEIICAGFGGQGIMSLGKFIADTALNEGFNVTCFPSYGAEVRGGTAHCMVVISDEEISSPIVSFCDTAIIMNQPSYEKFSRHIKINGRLIINSSMVKDAVTDNGIQLIKVPATEIADNLGNTKTANVVMLGIYLKYKKFLSKANVVAGIKKVFPGKNELVEINLKALEAGLDA